MPLLLVDAEAPVGEGRTVWQHLRASDGWEKPGNAQDDDAFLMVQIMETWFLADRAALERFFGARFNAQALPQWPQLEEAPKQDVLRALKRATAGCKKEYEKGNVTFELLGKIDAAKVEAACPHAHDLLERLRKL